MAMTAPTTADEPPIDQPTTTSDRPLVTAAALFRSLGDPNRLAILQHLAMGERRVRDLTEHLGLAQSTVSAHCRCLADCGLVSSRAHGRATVYSLARPELLTLFQVAEQVLLASGDAVDLCPTYGTPGRGAA